MDDKQEFAPLFDCRGHESVPSGISEETISFEWNADALTEAKQAELTQWYLSTKDGLGVIDWEDSQDG